jgi:glucuronate isomerase
MRANGVDERFCTGDATDWEKFEAWARTVPATLRNPLYHWTHLELARYFGIYDLLDEGTAVEIWRAANSQLASGSLSVHGILRKFDVRAICTTDDPTDPLEYHRAIERQRLPFQVLPAFRRDCLLVVADRPR